MTMQFLQGIILEGYCRIGYEKQYCLQKVISPESE